MILGSSSSKITTSGTGKSDFENVEINVTIEILENAKGKGEKIYTDASVFFQSNLSLLPVLVKRVKEVTEPNTLLVDLFSGVGFFAALLEDSFEKIGKYYYDDPVNHKNGEFDIVTESDNSYIFYEAKFKDEKLIIEIPT